MSRLKALHRNHLKAFLCPAGTARTSGVSSEGSAGHGLSDKPGVPDRAAGDELFLPLITLLARVAAREFMAGAGQDAHNDGH